MLGKTLSSSHDFRREFQNGKWKHLQVDIDGALVASDKSYTATHKAKKRSY